MKKWFPLSSVTRYRYLLSASPKGITSVNNELAVGAAEPLQVQHSEAAALAIL